MVAPFNAASLRDEDEARHGVVAGVDLHLLSSKLRQIDYDSIAKRRAAYNRLYHEALLLSEKGKGLSFKNTLMLLAHYKLLESEKSLL